MWFIIAIISFFLLAIAAVIDKFLLTKSKIIPLSYAFYAAVLGGLVSSLLLLIEQNFYLPTKLLWVLIIGGAVFYFALFFLYAAVKESEVSKVNPLIISLTPLLVFFLSLFLAVESVSLEKLGAICLIIVGSYGLSQVGLAPTKLNRQGWLMVIAACLMFALSNTFSKIAYNNLTFITAFVWLRWFALMTAIIVTTLKGGWPIIFNLKEKQAQKTKQKWLAFGIGQSAGGLGVILMQYAISLGSVTLVTALNGTQFFFVMLLVYILSKFYPQILEENITSKFIQQKVVWSLILFGGVFLILI